MCLYLVQNKLLFIMHMNTSEGSIHTLYIRICFSTYSHHRLFLDKFYILIYTSLLFDIPLMEQTFLPEGVFPITLLNGKTHYMHKGYSYYQENKNKKCKRWRCTRRGCKAYLIVSHDLNTFHAVHEHNHPSPKYHITADGRYLKL